MALAFALAVAFGLALNLLAWLSQLRALARPARRATEPLPPVSVLKPLKGADPDLEANLRSFFAQDYADFELLFGVQDASDYAIPVVRRLIAEHPEHRAHLVLSTQVVGLNPKVNNLAGLEHAAAHELLLISDSNVRVPPGYVSDLVARIQDPRVGLVSSLIRGADGSGLGGALESLQLDGFVMGGVATWSGVFRQPCVVGKSMLLRRTDLRRLGGWSFLGRFLAEDQVCGEEIARLGLRTVVSGRPVDNVLGRASVAGFAKRHLRWARIRRRINPLGYAFEILLEPVPLALAGAAVAGLAPGIPALALAARCLLAASAERRLDVSRPLLAYAPLELARSLVVAALWAVPFVSSTVTWRGHVLAVGPRSLLLEPTPTGAPAWDRDPLPARVEA